MVNPVFRRELRTVLRHFKTYAAIMVYALVLAFVAGVYIFAMSASGYGRGYNTGFNPQDTSALYGTLAGFQFGLVMIMTPALTAGAISGERERQTLNLMLITKMTPFKIALGKLLSSLMVTLLMIAAAMPVFAIVFFYGGVSLWDLIGVTAYTILCGLSMGSICIFMSSVFKRTVGATVSSYLVIMGLCIGTFFIALLAIGLLEMYRYSYSGQDSSFITYLENLDGKTLGNILALGYAALLSLNPFAGFLAILDKQLGTNAIQDFFNFVSSRGSADLGEHNLWVYNVLASLIVTALMLFFTSKVLRPVKESRRRK